MKDLEINGERLLQRIEELGQIGIGHNGARTRLAGSDEDRLGRDAIVRWATEAGLEVRIDRIGNIFAILGEVGPGKPNPVMIGSHIDTVIDAGALDGCYGVLAGLEAAQTLKEYGLTPTVPLVVAAFTNEEGVRYAPDMMGSAVFAGGVDLASALAAEGTDGSNLGNELVRIGYAGSEAPGFFRPKAYFELHIEQGPVLEWEGFDIGCVQGVQGISWKRITIDGQANHAGTTPMRMRRDAGVAAARLMTAMYGVANRSDEGLVATFGTLQLSPNAINVVPGKATLTLDMRSPSEAALKAGEDRLGEIIAEITNSSGCQIATETLARTEPVMFDRELVDTVGNAASSLGLKFTNMISGAGHDAQMIAPTAPTAMIFVPSEGGVSHNSAESTPNEQLLAGAQVLLRVLIDQITW
jgi:N-carbamoyl-L-amino-acid hydrolase